VGLVKSAQQTSTLGRGFRLGRLGFSLVGSYLGYQMQNLLLGEGDLARRKARLQQNASRQVREELGALKGPAMKLGQMLSLQSGALSVDALAELAQLQMQAPGMHPSLARAQFKSALGTYPEEAFRQFDPEPFAAASLGQVHRAVTHGGENVAVKIQYPAIRLAIENDCRLLRSATLPTRLTGHVPGALMDEIQRGLLEETDYLREADNLDFFRAGLSGLPYVTVPRVYRQLSSDRVLTMSFIPGKTFSDWLQAKPAQPARDELAARLIELYETQQRCLRRLHADQHPGNYLFLPDGGIGLIDFGCVKSVPFDVVELRRCYRQRVWQESEAAARKYLSLVCGPHVPYARARRLLPLLEQMADIVYPPGASADRVIDFGGEADWEQRMKPVQAEYRKRLLRDKLINPDFAFLIRADMGLHHLLHQLRARANLSEIWRRVDRAQTRGES